MILEKQFDFKDWYNSLPANEQTPTRLSILELCEWSDATFYRKLKNPSSVKKIERNAINTIAKITLTYDNKPNILSKYKLVKSQ